MENERPAEDEDDGDDEEIDAVLKANRDLRVKVGEISDFVGKAIEKAA